MICDINDTLIKNTETNFYTTMHHPNKTFKLNIKSVCIFQTVINKYILYNFYWNTFSEKSQEHFQFRTIFGIMFTGTSNIDKKRLVGDRKIDSEIEFFSSSSSKKIAGVF